MTNNGKIAFLDLVGVHEELEKELVAVFQKALKTAGFIGGPMVEEFERSFAEFCGTRFALIAAGVREGDAVVTVANTFIATTEAISQAGARPEFVDIDERTYNMDPEKLRNFLEQQCSREGAGKLVSRRSGRPVTAVVPVHLYGQCADMDAIQDLADRYNLIVIEDACQAHGAEYFSKRDHRWKKAGTMGKAAAFSFYPGKNLGACGEAGIATTEDEEMARNMRMLRDHGQAKKYYHDIEGYNGRLDSIQAGWLSVKLRHLAKWNEARRTLAHRYHELLSEMQDAVVVPQEAAWMNSVYHLYVLRVQDREALQADLAEAGIGTGIHYPIPLHLQKAYEHLGYKRGAFPITERVAAEIVSLPMFPQMTSEQQDEVAQ